MNSYIELGPMIEGYLDFLRDVSRLAPGSIKDFRCTFRQTLRFMQKIRPGIELWRLRLDDYLVWVEESRQQGKTVRTIAKDISHLRGIIDYAWRSGRTDRNVLDGFKLKDLKAAEATPPGTLSLEEAERLVHACPRSTVQERADRLIILILYGCGLRTHELCMLGFQDIDREKQEIFVHHGKGGVQRRIPVPDGVWIELLAFLTERGGKKGPLLHTRVKGKRICSKDVLLIVYRAVQRAGLSEDITPRTLRHSFASHLMDQGVDVAMIASLMGHRGPQESGVYLHALPGRKEAAVARLASHHSAEIEKTKGERS